MCLIVTKQPDYNNIIARLASPLAKRFLLQPNKRNIIRGQRITPSFTAILDMPGGSVLRIQLLVFGPKSSPTCMTLFTQKW